MRRLAIERADDDGGQLAVVFQMSDQIMVGIVVGQQRDARQAVEAVGVAHVGGVAAVVDVVAGAAVVGLQDRPRPVVCVV